MYGRACFLHTRIEGMARAMMKMIECVGPRCSRPGISRSTSAIIEAAKSKGMLAVVFRSFDVPFPKMYPKAMWPTANVAVPLYSSYLANSWKPRN